VPVKLKINKLSDVLKFIDPKLAERILDRFMALAAEYVWSETARLAPYRTGRLVRSIIMRRRGPIHYVIGTPVEYAPYIEFGTRPHIIEPRRAKALRFIVHHEIVFARRVQHPGTKPRRFFARALLILRDAPLRLKLIRRAIEEVMRKK